MSILRKIMTAIRGGTREVGDLLVDANGARIFEQEIKDAEQHLRKAKHDLTAVMAKQMQASRQLSSLKKEITDHEKYARQALNKDDETLAMEIADKIFRLETEVTDQQQVHDTFAGHVNRLRELVKKTERQVKDYQRQLSMVKTTESVQKASAAITENFASSNSRMLSAKESLERIKKRQQDNFDRLEAAEQMAYDDSDKGLDDRMKAAGIGAETASAKSILDRIKSNQA